jgi:ankyrin repeat protein
MFEFVTNRCGVNVNAVDSTGKTPLHWAANFKNKGMVECLVAHRADINIADQQGLTPLYLAAGSGDMDIVKFLLGQGADFLAVSDEFGTLLHAAAKSKNTEMIDFFLELGIGIDAVNKNGMTPLHTAEHLDIGTVEYLLNRGASINACCKWGTPLHFVIEAEREDLVKLLVNLGANVDIPNEDGETPLDVAIRLERMSMIEFLSENGAHVNLYNQNWEDLLYGPAGSSGQDAFFCR